MTDTHELDTLISAAAPPLPDAPELASALDRAWSTVATELDAAPASPTRLPGRRGWTKAGIAMASIGVLAIGASGVAAAWVATHTGVQMPAAEVAMGGPGELLRVDGDDYPAVLGQQARDIPFVSEAARATALREIYAADHTNADAPAPDGSQAETTTGALRAEIARAAICSFEADWHLADAAGDPARRARATSSLVAALSWPAVTDIDPHPTMTEPSEIGPRPSLFGYLVEMATAAKAGDAAKLTAATDASSFCHLPSNDRVFKAQAPTGQAPTSPAPGDQTQAPQPTTYTPLPGAKK